MVKEEKSSYREMSRVRRVESKDHAKIFSKFVNAHDENILLRHQSKVPSPRNNAASVLNPESATIEFAPHQAT